MSQCDHTSTAACRPVLVVRLRGNFFLGGEGTSSGRRSADATNLHGGTASQGEVVDAVRADSKEMLKFPF